MSRKKKTCIKEEKKMEALSPSTFVRHMGSMCNAETGYMKNYAGKVFVGRTNSTETKEMFWNVSGRRQPVS